MKKIISLVMALCFLFTMTCIASASTDKSLDDDDYAVFYYENTEIGVERKTSSDEDLKKIADFIAGENNSDGISTQGININCNLFGHILSTRNSYTIKHCVNPAPKRCTKSLLEIEECSRCDYKTEKVMKTENINCCN